MFMLMWQGESSKTRNVYLYMCIIYVSEVSSDSEDKLLLSMKGLSGMRLKSPLATRSSSKLDNGLVEKYWRLITSCFGWMVLDGPKGWRKTLILNLIISKTRKRLERRKSKQKTRNGFLKVVEDISLATPAVKPSACISFDFVCTVERGWHV